LTVYLLGDKIEVEFLLDHAGKEAADRMLPPVRRLHDRGDGGAPFGSYSIFSTADCLDDEDAGDFNDAAFEEAT
jgi:hypothetical protein